MSSENICPPRVFHALLMFLREWFHSDLWNSFARPSMSKENTYWLGGDITIIHNLLKIMPMQAMFHITYRQIMDVLT